MPVSRGAQDDKEETALDIKKRKRLERDPLHQGLIVERSQLKQRDYQIDLAARLGKTQVRACAAPRARGAVARSAMPRGCLSTVAARRWWASTSR